MSHRDTSWMDDRACADADPETLTPVTITAAELAEICHNHCDRCPVRAQCLAYGTETRENGIYGGQFLIRGKPKRYTRSKPGRVVHQGTGHTKAARAQGAATALDAWRLLRSARPFMDEGQLSREQVQALDLRLRHPRLDASRLAEMAYPPVSRHAMNGRLRRLCEMAQAVLEAEGAPARSRVEVY